SCSSAWRSGGKRGCRRRSTTRTRASRNSGTCRARICGNTCSRIGAGLRAGRGWREEDEMPHYVSKTSALKTQRITAGFSIGDLAKVANVTDWTIRRLEAGGTEQSHVVQKIADALG